jgi:hypothetical protein
VCALGANGAVLENGICVLPDAIDGMHYAGHLLTSHQAGGTLSIVSGALPPGLALPATFTGSGDTIGGTPPEQATNVTDDFTVQDPATRASRCTRPTRSASTRTSRWLSRCPPVDQPSFLASSGSPMRRTSSSAAAAILIPGL